MTQRVEAVLPRWARALDWASAGLVLLSLTVMIFGGFREWTPFGRLSVTSWIRPLFLALVLLLVRHAVRRRPAISDRMLDALRRWRNLPEARVLWPIFLSTRFGVLIVGFLGLALFGYAPNATPWHLYENEFLNLPSRWDTGWYLGIAVDGYQWRPSSDPRYQQNIAFFPMYPMLMRYGSLFFARQHMWVGVIVSFVSFFLALKYLFRLTRLWIDDDGAAATLAFIATYPFALFYSAAYTESLFLLTIVGACYHFERSELAKAAAWGLVAGLTRPNGCLLSVPLAFIALRPWLSNRDWHPLLPRLAAAAAPGIGMLIYSAYIYSLTGNPLQWTTQNAAWGRVYRGVDVLVGERIEFLQQYGFYDYATNRSIDMLYVVCVVFVLASVWPVYRRFGLPYAVIILLNVIPPLTMGGLLSMGRVTSVIFPAFMWLGAVVPVRHRLGWLVLFAMLQAVCAVAFFTWRPLY
jgi:Mannosyltransferase (PIG-V)